MKRKTLYAAIMLCASTALSNALNAPSNLKATAVSSNRTNLRWTDNANFESGFIIQRSTDGTNFAFLASVASNVTSYGNTGLKPRKTYWYRVRAFRSSNSKVSAWSNMARATTFAAPTSAKKIIHWQTFSNSASVSSVVANHTYIDTLPFDGIVVSFPDYQNCLGPNYIASYTTLYNQIGSMKNVLAHVKHNYAVVVTGNSGMVDPFDNWTQTQANFVTLALVCRDAGLEGFVFDNEEYNVHWWQYPNDCKYASTKTAAEYRNQWRLRGTQVMQAIIAQWPQAKILVTIGPNRSVRAVPAGAMFNGDPNWMGGYFFMGLFAGAPIGKHVISGGELYYNRTVTQFSNWKNFFDTMLTQSPQSPPLMASSLYSTWTNNANLSFGIYDQDRVGTPAMTYSVLQQTIINAMPYVDEFVWNYSENLDWLTPGAGSEGNWQNAVWNARSQLGLPPP
jgi:hypothetical protein